MKKPETKRAGLGLVFVLAAILAVAVWAGSSQGQRYIAPGKLLGDHAEKRISCPKCHQAFQGIPNPKCLRCHKRVARQMDSRRGRHAGMRGACINCHIMHRMPGKKGTRVDKNSVDHSLVRFSLEKHEAQSCRDCHGSGFKHKNLNSRCIDCHRRSVVKSGKSKVIKPDEWITSLNFDRHRREAGDKCLDCHVGGSRVEYRHRQAADFFTGQHAIKKCDMCHRRQQYTGLSRECVSCHKNPHKTVTGEDCLRCHNQTDWDQTKMKHDASQECEACHKMPRGHFAGGCRDCHKTTKSWKTSIKHPRMEEHSARSYPCIYCHPTGHKSVDCRRCHKSRFPKGDHDLRPGIDEDD